MSKIMALIPAYNEEKHLPAVLEALKPLMETIVVVDDGSVDQTKSLSEAAGVIVLSRGFNRGNGYSLREGLAWALEHDFDAVVLLDGDGQHAPNEITRFVEKFKESPSELIIGARNYAEMPLRRRIPNTLGRILLEIATGVHFPDNQSGYRLVNRAMMEKLMTSHESGFNFQVEMINIALEQGWQIGWVPISTIYGDENSHQNAWYQITGFTKMCRQARKAVQQARKLNL